MSQLTIGLLHPGEMGATVGAAARANGALILWFPEGRGLRTRERAERADLSEAQSLADLAERSQAIFSVCPPSAALDVAHEVAGLGFRGVFVDANAVSPTTAREIGAVIETGGGHFVDGGIVGPPALKRGTTRLYLSGGQASTVVAIFAQGPLEAIALDAPIGAASGLKMAYAAYTKGTAALLAAIRALSTHEGVDDALLREWRLSQPELVARAEGMIRGAVSKAWRFAGEMEEIAATFEAVGLPGGFHKAAADIYQRLSRFKDAPIPALDEVLATLLEQPRAKPELLSGRD